MTTTELFNCRNCGPNPTEPHPRLAGVRRCSNCKGLDDRTVATLDGPALPSAAGPQTDADDGETVPLDELRAAFWSADDDTLEFWTDEQEQHRLAAVRDLVASRNAAELARLRADRAQRDSAWLTACEQLRTELVEAAATVKQRTQERDQAERGRAAERERADHAVRDLAGQRSRANVAEAERDDARYAAEQARAGVVAERERADKAEAEATRLRKLAVNRHTGDEDEPGDDPVAKAMWLVARRFVAADLAYPRQSWDDYPEVGEGDFEEVESMVSAIRQGLDPEQADYDAAYALLRDRAQGNG